MTWYNIPFITALMLAKLLGFCLLGTIVELTVPLPNACSVTGTHTLIVPLPSAMALFRRRITFWWPWWTVIGICCRSICSEFSFACSEWHRSRPFCERARYRWIWTRLSTSSKLCIRWECCSLRRWSNGGFAIELCLKLSYALQRISIHEERM